MINLRMPRPVELPAQYFPVPGIVEPDAIDQTEVFATCIVQHLGGSGSIFANKVGWQDPTYNRQLIAVAQQKDKEFISVLLDRKVYGPKDVMYVEVILQEAGILMDNWSVGITLDLSRQIYGVQEVLDQQQFMITAERVTSGSGEEFIGVRKEVLSQNSVRFVLEVGVDTRQAAHGNFNMPIEHNDQLSASVQYSAGQRNEKVELLAFVNAKESVWPTPQSAFAVVRKKNLGERVQPQVAAFGWMAKPTIIRRRDLFDPASWYASFSYVDFAVELKDDEASVQYEVRTILPGGEQSMNEFIWE